MRQGECADVRGAGEGKQDASPLKARRERRSAFARSHLLLDLNAGRAVDVPHHRDGETPLAVGCRGHRDEGHRVGQGVQDRLVGALLQHGCKDHLLVALSAAQNRGGWGGGGSGSVTAGVDLLVVKLLLKE